MTRPQQFQGGLGLNEGQRETLRLAAQGHQPVGPSRRSECLATAERLVNGERNTQYDEPSADFKRIAGMWSAYLGVPIELHDVAAMMVLLKMARVRHSPTHGDNWVDGAGYSACGFDVAGAE